MFGTLSLDRGIEMGAVLETSQAGCLKDYGVVQFIRGCAFEASKDLKSGLVSKRIYSVRDFKGDPSFPFRHQNWVVDQTGIDPIYSSADPVEGHPELTEEDLRFGELRYLAHSFQLKNTTIAIAQIPWHP